MAALIAIGQVLWAVARYVLSLCGHVLLALLRVAMRRPVQATVVCLMLYLLYTILHGGPNHSHSVDRASRLVVPIALLLVVLVAGRRFLKLPKF